MHDLPKATYSCRINLNGVQNGVELPGGRPNPFADKKVMLHAGSAFDRTMNEINQEKSELRIQEVEVSV